jgi:hypothetical protein
MLLIAQPSVYDSVGPAVIVAFMDAAVIIEVGVVVTDIVDIGDVVVAMV